MVKALKLLGAAVTVFIVLLYLVSIATPFISPKQFPVLTIITIGYLPILICYMLLTAAWFFFNRKICLLLVLVFFLGSKNFFSTVGINVFRGEWNWQKKQDNIRVMCWNVNEVGAYFPYQDTVGGRRRRMLELIERAQPDILCVQDLIESEARSDTSLHFVKNVADIMTAGKFLHSYFPYFYYYDGSNYANKAGVAIFSKFPVSDTSSLGFGQHGQRAGYVDLLIKDKKLRVYAAHFASMSLWPSAKEEAGLAYLRGDSTTVRAKKIYTKVTQYGALHADEAVLIRRYVDSSPHPVLFSADLNSVPSGYVYHHLKGDMKDAFLGGDYGIGGTYNRVFPKLRIDVLFHSRMLEVRQFTRPAVDISDHYPLIIDLQWKE
ncbi:MAG: endonuclease/exonuclease/phosphatase [Chitinophagaceae bacterium]|jgi:endonuclease/exonuclease/phosphatase family metal-dependent hydrolase|nr:endonuclease/exonuclease/phosphatase [Chitinophagaceae bacterium]